MRTPAPTDIAYYEGLIHKTASMYVNLVDDDFDDIVSVLRIKVWKALRAFDPSKVRTQTVEKYIFMCVKNQCKDLIRKKRRHEVLMDDLSPDGGDAPVGWMRQLSTDHEQEYGAVEEEELLVPSTLSALERRVVFWLYLDRTHREVADLLGLTRAEMERAVRTIRQKMADWRPSERVGSTSMAVPAELPRAA
jgi:RNA polymerase sigma factor (sigma-70 family)